MGDSDPAKTQSPEVVGQPKNQSPEVVGQPENQSPEVGKEPKEVRMILPLCIVCKACGNYMRSWTKFRARKEAVAGEKYKGIQIFRYHFNCTNCSADMSYKTDPKNSGYIVESAARRKFESVLDAHEEAIVANRRLVVQQFARVVEDTIKALDSQREMVSNARWLRLDDE